jgi:carbamoyl-phosphate synthase large subunit
MVAASLDVPLQGKLIATIADHDKEEAIAIISEFSKLGYDIYATHGTASYLEKHGIHSTPIMKIHQGEPNLLGLIRSGEIDLLINTLSTDKRTEREALQIRRASVETGIPCLTSLDTSRALLLALKARKRGENFACFTVDEYLKGSGTLNAIK